jgi:hypothetical protein
MKEAWVLFDSNGRIIIAQKGCEEGRGCYPDKSGWVLLGDYDVIPFGISISNNSRKQTKLGFYEKQILIPDALYEHGYIRFSKTRNYYNRDKISDDSKQLFNDWIDGKVPNTDDAFSKCIFCMGEFSLVDRKIRKHNECRACNLGVFGSRCDCEYVETVENVKVCLYCEKIDEEYSENKRREELAHKMELETQRRIRKWEACDVFLDVPFECKEDAKILGARWCPHARKWYYSGDATKPARWLSLDYFNRQENAKKLGIPYRGETGKEELVLLWGSVEEKEIMEMILCSREGRGV